MRFEPYISSAKQWISQMQLAVAYRAKSTEKNKKQSYFCCFHITSNSSQKHQGEVQLGSNWGPCPYISLFRKVAISLTNVSHHQLLVLINSDQRVCPLTSLNNLVVIYCLHKFKLLQSKLMIDIFRHKWLLFIGHKMSEQRIVTCSRNRGMWQNTVLSSNPASLGRIISQR